ncbi:hypothetical protein OF83DRAFT_1178848 [Amylostereum chailletii]|nr:hypothetical protein OF83DRAFT_1179137 [Amylostereum chailletii]KAI0310167.1 hypothetical protein OF83DRAFT_1178848 [Amylostereum chailletii]
MSVPHIPLPAQGRGDLKGPAPVSLDWAYKDPETPLPVVLAVRRPLDPAEDPRGLHWALGWPILPDKSIWRSLQVYEHYREYDPPPQPRLVFWGPMTTSESPGINAMRHVPLKTMTLEERRAMEAIAQGMEVYAPNGVWNCQNWVKTVLGEAVEKGLLSAEECERTVNEAELPDAGTEEVVLIRVAMCVLDQREYRASSAVDVRQ